MAFSNLNEQHAKAMKDLRDYMELKYGSAYMNEYEAGRIQI